MRPEVLTACRLAIDILNGKTEDEEVQKNAKKQVKEFLSILEKELTLERRDVEGWLAKQSELIS